MPQPPPRMMTRRRFLHTGVVGGALAATLPAFLDHTLFSIEAAETDSPLQRPHGRDAPILVLMQLAGGNDGLNTLIPLDNDHYRRARPRLGQVESAALSLAPGFGLHESLTGLKALYDEGLLNILQGVGYPNPNRSHFRSTEIWHTGSSDDRNVTDGWVGRFFDNQCQGMAPETGISLTATPPQAFQGPSSLGISFTNPDQFRFSEESELTAGSSIGMATGEVRRGGNETLSFLERTHLDARVSSDTLHETLKRVPAPGGFPNNRLGSDLGLIARLIGGGMSTRVYYCSQGGYDTHANQLNSHARLLRELGDGLHAFWREMRRQGNEKRVCLLVFSEFGRRVAENGSNGTDHGASAPLFVMGGGVKAGLFGEAPSLDPARLVRGDPVHTLDFRQIYATILAKHLGVAPGPILGGKFSPVPIL